MNDEPGSANSRSPRATGAASQSSFWHGWRERLARMLTRNGENSVRETLEELIEDSGPAAEDLNRHERTLLANILKLRDQTVADVMVPRADIVAIRAEAPLSELIDRVKQGGHSRIPVYQDTLDDAIGMVHFKDVLDCAEANGDFKLRELVRDVLFVAPSMHVLELLLEMRVKRTHMALVVDEFGGVDGLLTIEDLVEEIVGEIEDEHDQESGPDVDLRPDGAIDADARVLIEDFEARFGPVVSDDERAEIDSLGGLVFSVAGRVPIRGELISHASGMEIEILDADPRRIKRIRIRGVGDADADAEIGS